MDAVPAASPSASQLASQNNSKPEPHREPTRRKPLPAHLPRAVVVHEPEIACSDVGGTHQSGHCGKRPCRDEATPGGAGITSGLQHWRSWYRGCALAFQANEVGSSSTGRSITPATSLAEPAAAYHPDPPLAAADRLNDKRIRVHARLVALRTKWQADASFKRAMFGHDDSRGSGEICTWSKLTRQKTKMAFAIC